MARTTSTPARSTASKSSRRLDPAGHFHDTVELFGGQRVFDANTNVEEELKKRARLWHRSDFSHQYPHCWRCHNPVIFLATSQWFIRMDGEPAIAADGQQPETLRQAALNAIDKDGEVGSRRGATIASTTWCRAGPTGASRASARGVCRFPPWIAWAVAKRSPRPSWCDKAAGVFEQHGAHAWYERPVEDFLPARV